MHNVKKFFESFKGTYNSIVEFFDLNQESSADDRLLYTNECERETVKFLAKCTSKVIGNMAAMGYIVSNAPLNAIKVTIAGAEDLHDVMFKNQIEDVSFDYKVNIDEELAVYQQRNIACKVYIENSHYKTFPVSKEALDFIEESSNIEEFSDGFLDDINMDEINNEFLGVGELFNSGISNE